MITSGAPTTATSSAACTLAAFLDHPRIGRPEGLWKYDGLTVDDLLAAGITLPDVLTYRATSMWVADRPQDCPRVMATELAHLAVRHGSLALQDAVAWVIVGDQVGPTAYALADTWAQDAPELDLALGWWFAAAGISAREAGSMLGLGGEVPVVELTLMAGLRGVALPWVATLAKATPEASE